MEHEAKVEIVDLTRQLAEELSEHIPKYQRQVRPRWIRALASDIDNGRWRLGDSAIVVATDDKGRAQLQNGQHRVWARLRAETDPPCPTILLTRTVDDIDDYLAVDAGKKRIFADYLRLQEESGAQVKSGIVRVILLTRIGGVPGFTLTQKFDISHAEMARLWADRDPELMEATVKLYYRLVRPVGGVAARFLASLYYIVNEQSPELDIDGFVDQILNGPTLTMIEDEDGNVEQVDEIDADMNAALLLRRRLASWSYGDQRTPRTLVTRSILKAWNMWLAGETGRMFRAPKSNKGLQITPTWAVGDHLDDDDTGEGE